MLVCIPTSSGEGLNSRLFGHFGSSPFFTLYNTDTEEVQVIENRNSHHSHGTCHPMNQLCIYKIDTVLCNGMGRRAVEALNAEGIETKISESESVQQAIADLQNGKTLDIDPSKACRGHGQHQDHNEKDVSVQDQGFRTGQGRGIGRGQGIGINRGRGQGRNQGSGGKR
ncbi:MAG: hypothetical protein DWP97_05750 [Calditrichaeota bacterium]|nr:MAG: hypothetical protein DWP97_05750 [Calditrichota bacterium]